jgi:hypothetical protein
MRQARQTLVIESRKSINTRVNLGVRRRSGTQRDPHAQRNNLPYRRPDERNRLTGSAIIASRLKIQRATAKPNAA